MWSCVRRILLALTLTPRPHHSNSRLICLQLLNNIVRILSTAGIVKDSKSEIRAFKMTNEGSGKYQFFDIGANLVDDMYQGVYNGSKKHEPDLNKVLERASAVGVKKILVTAGNLEESLTAAQTVSSMSTKSCELYSTVGVHPTRCNEFKDSESPEKYCQDLIKILQDHKSKVRAIGEFGLDYERTQFCNIETQKRFFELQLTSLSKTAKLPLFLHCRGAAADLAEILRQNEDCFSNGGVVHSFDGSLDEMQAFLDLGFHIGINGCSMKTEENCDVIKEIPVECLLLETDAPWCGIRPSHFSSKFIKTKFEASKKNWSESIMYKSRNEPQTIVNILEVVAALKEMDTTSLSEIVYKNSIDLFCKND